MKRDPDLVRSILAKIEDYPDFIASLSVVGELADPRLVVGHLKLLEDENYLDCARSPKGAVMGWRITWKGHEFIEATRDPDVWSKTKAGAKKVGSASIPFMLELATGYVKAKATALGLPMM